MGVFTGMIHPYVGPLTQLSKGTTLSLCDVGGHKLFNNRIGAIGADVGPYLSALFFSIVVEQGRETC